MQVQPAINKVAMLILMQPDLDKAIAFYQELGIQLKFRMKDTWAEFELEGIKIGLCQTPHPAQDNRTGIVLQVANLQHVYTDLKEKVTFLSEPVSAAHGVMTSIKDPGGNILDLYQPTPERLKEALEKAAQEAEKTAEADQCCKPQNCCKNDAPKTSCC